VVVRSVDCCQPERRAGIAQCYISKVTGKLIEEEQQLFAAVMIGGRSYKGTTDTAATTSFVSEEMADNTDDLGRITRTRRQVRLADGRCGGINAQLIRQQTSDHEPVDFTRSSGSVGVGIKLPETSRTQWMARGEAIGSSRSTSKRVGRYYNVPESRAGRLQHIDGNIDYGRTPDQNDGWQAEILPKEHKMV